MSTSSARPARATNPAALAARLNALDDLIRALGVRLDVHAQIQSKIIDVLTYDYPSEAVKPVREAAEAPVPAPRQRGQLPEGWSVVQGGGKPSKRSQRPVLTVVAS